MDTPIIENVRVTPKGQVIIPRHICEKLKLSEGDNVDLVYEGGKLTIEPPLIAALHEFQKGMEGEAEKAGLHSDDDVVNLIMEMRREEERKRNT